MATTERGSTGGFGSSITGTGNYTTDIGYTWLSAAGGDSGSSSGVVVTGASPDVAETGTSPGVTGIFKSIVSSLWSSPSFFFCSSSYSFFLSYSSIEDFGFYSLFPLASSFGPSIVPPGGV